MGQGVLAYPFLLWWLRKYLLFILLSTLSKKYEPLAILYGYVMRQLYKLYVLLCFMAADDLAMHGQWWKFCLNA